MFCCLGKKYQVISRREYISVENKTATIKFPVGDKHKTM